MPAPFIFKLMRHFHKVDRRNFFKPKGFTLLELMIAVVVIGLGLLGMLLANTYIQTTSEAAHERMTATQDAHQVIELMRNVSATGNFPGNVTGAYPNGGTVSGFTNLSGEAVTVAYTDPTADPLDITVTASWLELGRRNVSTQLRTLMTKRN